VAAAGSSGEGQGAARYRRALAVLASAGGKRVPVTVPLVLTSEDRVRIEYLKAGAHTHCFCQRSRKHERAPKWWTRISQTARTD
jgi:hypothetical protein